MLNSLFLFRLALKAQQLIERFMFKPWTPMLLCLEKDYFCSDRDW
jgi:hypothetical protein